MRLMMPRRTDRVYPPVPLVAAETSFAVALPRIERSFYFA